MLTTPTTPNRKITNSYTPLKIANVKISTQEHNLDKDILTNKPIMQIQASMSNIYNHNTKYIATLNIERLQWLWNQFSHDNLLHLTNFLQPPSPDFETKILWLVQRYITTLPKKKLKKYTTKQPAVHITSPFY